MLIDREQRLIEQLKKQDEKAFSAIYSLYVKRVYTYALHILKSPGLAEDVVQETFIKLWENASFIQSDRPLQPFIFTIARNKALNVLRRAAHETWITDEMTAHIFDEKEDAHAYVQRKQTAEFINDAVNLLPPQRRLIYDLCRNNGYSYKQVAEKLGIKDSTVNSQMVKALKFIRSFMIKNGALLLVYLIKF